MKIIDKRKPVTTFADIKQGECFIDNDGDTCMKIEEWGDHDVNAIDLANGATYYFDFDIEVTPIKTSLIIYDSEE